ncbi:OmpA family protein [Geomonas sp. RF6]|uniref:OmpA family protein n=1 Tax=Geomonas sp. RF6 TaxID=2897342 RepID=UPI001E36FE55|nr:OmpA family protein [Geomonas sp. RF6]UFS71703.1 OmpA family protein [Geomonas sp. RF6]
MKRYLLLILVPALFLTVPNLASAGVNAESFSVTPVVGGYTFMGAEHLTTRPAYGIRFGYNFTSNFGAELAFDYIRTHQNTNTSPYGVSPGEDVSVYKYGLDFLYHFMPEGPFVPYLAAGFSEITRDYPEPAGTRHRPAFNYGLGMKYFFADNMAVRTDLRHIVMDDNKTYHNLEYLLGLDFLFGGAKPAALPAAATPAPAPAAPAPGKEAPLAPVPAAEPSPGHYKYCMTLHIEFDIDQALIRPEYHNEIAKVGEFMKKYPTTTAVIEGHTDNVGNAEYNMDLSQRRAQAVVDYLCDKFGIDGSRLSARGYGLTRPIADNATEQGRQQNRRIEAIIDCAFDVKQAPPPQRLCMTLDLEFDTGKADIKPDCTGDVDKLGEYMNTYPTTTAVIEGHTDNTGSYEGNMKLSQQRAEAVVNYLVEKCGIDRSRLSAKGYGSSRRVAYNNTAEGRQKNRRINAVVDCVIKK